MANRKKKKTQPKLSVKRDLEVTKTYFDDFSSVARKTLQTMELDPALYDNFTKKQKIEMMRAKFAPPRFEIKNGHNVPRHYLKMIQQESYEFMKGRQVGKPEIGLSYFDYLTMGIAFLSNVESLSETVPSSSQTETYSIIANRFTELENDKTSNLMMPYLRFLQYMLYRISQINYRLYGFEMEWRELERTVKLAVHIVLVSVESEKKYFNYQNNLRPAFRMAMGNFMSSQPTYLFVPYNKVIEGSNQTHLLNIYIQNHAISRLKERIDTLTHFERNLCLMTSVVQCETVRFSNGRYVIKYNSIENQLLAYLPFTIIGNDLFILTILPITSPATPEGKSLCDALNITKEELNFFKMDKLSFFKSNDFETMPILKKALKETNLWYMTEIKNSDIIDIPQITQSTGMIARFFQSERTHEEVLCEIEEKY